VAKIRIGNWRIDKNIVLAIAVGLILLVALLLVTAVDFWGVYNIENLDLIVFIGLMVIILIIASAMASLLSP
jgi:hypothetical protein